jgi:hypothetical protein
MNDDNVQPASPAQQTMIQRKGFGVDASPFNGVKLELAIILVLGIVLGLLVDSITADAGLQIALLAAYGIIAGGWIFLRTRLLMKKVLAGSELSEHPSNSQQAKTGSETGPAA